MSVPSVKEASLNLIQFFQPIVVSPTYGEVVSESKKTKPLYNLVGGRRTLQLIAEQCSRDARICAVLLEDNSFDKKTMEALDVLNSILLRRPNDASMALLAFGLLEDAEFREAVSTILDANRVEDVATLLGKSKATVHRMVSADLRNRLRKRSNASHQDSDASLGEALDLGSNKYL
ncbi:hypothetical protein GALL_26440 [mine drainage metagenome]|uniref:Uncharacterized protein n=1 Tax=mine drainage metagenome TaxID=410659 RepID=A0A1J5TKW4_9ZZZZ